MLGVLASRSGDSEEARRNLARSLELADHLADPPRARCAQQSRARLPAGGELDRGDSTEARAGLEACRLPTAIATVRRRSTATWPPTLRQAGRDEEAMEHLKRGVAIFAEVGGASGRARPEIWKLVEW